MDDIIYRHLSDGGLWTFTILLIVIGMMALVAGMSVGKRRGYI